jgi:hypothetical protein
MATTLASTLYPPQFSSTIAPAFSRTSTLRVYFSISSFNSASSIQRCHISIVNQSSGESVVDTNSSLLFAIPEYDSQEGLYYVDISVGNIKGTVYETDDLGEKTLKTSGWQINQYYKLQIRFDSYSSEEAIPNDESYFNTYSQYFSEWSQVLLLRPISEPSVYLLPFDTTEVEDGATVSQTLNPGILHLSGAVSFEESSEKETLKSYSVKILNGSTEEVVADKIVEEYTGNSVDPNVIDCRINLASVSSSSVTKYLLAVTCVTKNNYTFTSTRAFAIGEYTSVDNFDPDVQIDTSAIDKGVVYIHLTNADVLNGGTVYITRSSNLSNFKEWETIEEISALGSLNVTITDNTIGSGIFYRYAAQMENTVGGMTKIYNGYYYEEDDELHQKIYTVFPDFYDAILSRDGKQISIRYNYKVSSVKPTVSRTKMDVLGGKYPKFVENAAMNYKQLSISGLISSQEDENGLFLTKEDVYQDMLANYKSYEESEYRDAYNIENYNYFWEREFREELIKWLNDGEPKLYRSMTEGMLVVMITDISLTPNSTLSRRLWDFSATLYEVADGSSLETLDELGIYNRKLLETSATASGTDDGKEDQKTAIKIEEPGQLYRIYPPKSSDGLTSSGEIVYGVIDKTMQSQYNKNGSVYSAKNYGGLYLTDVRIQFLSNPSVYKLTQEGGVERQTEGVQLLNKNQDGKGKLDESLRLGFRFAVETAGDSSTNGKIEPAVFFVNERGYYQIPNSVKVTKLYITNPDDLITIDYVLHYEQTDDSSSQVVSVSIEKIVIGQYRDVYSYGEYCGDAIKKRYNFVTSEYKQMMQWFKGICVDVDPYTWLKVRYEGDDSYQKILVGETGVFHFLEDFAVDSIGFEGRYMTKVSEERAGYADSWEFILPKVMTSYNSTDDIESPVLQMVYNVKGLYYIYYGDGYFYRINVDGDTATAKVPVQGDINYYGNVVKMTLG